MRAVAIVGGNAGNGSKCGFYVNVNNAASNANWNIAPGNSYYIRVLTKCANYSYTTAG